jgi:hypothetical protein
MEQTLRLANTASASYEPDARKISTFKEGLETALGAMHCAIDDWLGAQEGRAGGLSLLQVIREHRMIPAEGRAMSPTRIAPAGSQSTENTGPCARRERVLIAAAKRHREATRWLHGFELVHTTGKSLLMAASATFTGALLDAWLPRSMAEIIAVTTASMATAISVDKVIERHTKRWRQRIRVRLDRIGHHIHRVAQAELSVLHRRASETYIATTVAPAIAEKTLRVQAHAHTLSLVSELRRRLEEITNSLVELAEPPVQRAQRHLR